MEPNEDMDKMSQIAGPAMRLCNEITKDIVAQNVLSEFIEKELPNFFDDGTGGMAGGFLVKMMMKEANEDPKKVLRKFLTFYNAFRDFYMTLEKSAEADANPPTMEEEAESVDEEVEEEIQAEEDDDSATEDKHTE